MLPESLRFQVGLIDQISKPLGNIQRNLNDVTNTYRQGTHTMMAGAAGMVGAGFALQNALMPAIEMDRVLGEVKSLGVADEQLQQLSDTALNFAVDYGKSATEFVAASYDIQSAISGLAGNELSEFTRASGVLAAATKADTSTITNYVGTMYGIFQNSANQMGKADWVNMLGGQTARAVQMFKTTGDQMSAAFTSVGASATSVGVGMTEQMAILGTLQSTMSGSEAGTKYRAFLAGAAKAQDALNMSFTDSQGQLLPIVDILNQIKGRYGDTISVAEAAELSKAFGTQEATAMIQLLMQNTDGLANSINDLGKVQGLDVAEQMAGAMTDQWERLEQGVFAVRAAFGQALLPVILPVVEMFANGAKEIMLWTKLFPNITKYIGLAAVALLGLVAVGGMITMFTGAVTVAWATLGLGATAIKGATFAMWSFSKSTMAAMWSVVKLTAALLVNPITWVVIGIVAAIAAVAALVYYWDDLKAAFLTFTTMAKQGWNDFLFAMQNTAAFQAVTGLAESMRNAFMSVFNWIIGKYNQVMDMVKSVTSWIPGLGGDDESTQVKSKSVQSATPRAQIQPGGAAKNIASYQTSSTNYGGVAIYPTYMNSPQDMASEIEMAAG
ncbi:phage tail tape measure protein [Vibrio parahaemolyticus]|uniref:Phage tail tape measure protein domain-containing protein n=1 Tax=Vibrio phage vB_ValM-yong1 TaxID=2660715 RepID=A0A6M3A3I0_9CAUD|nr:phage tail tape measure protein [Vibrio parahaemolyticus]YP_009885072.1 tail tape measure protein [Vibrio phage Valm-yong1]HCZ9306317.1 phage tail tape measure protein [Vibrio alginolyticus]MBM5118042.1 phage tail tape measure protein [Vibrio parahaemolyticus]MBM5121420.1 phage tail tape measure protein [Vibrio parahaemolyticus]MBM5131834.1 phage tail tape measure protein [Vibrio parahaemolyticus]MBM5138581.1 phage tail tape measure protein [Vibrio parahaemolyticus]